MRRMRCWVVIVLVVLGFQHSPLHAADPVQVAMLIPGSIDDGGIMQAGYEGLLAVDVELEADTRYIANVRPKLSHLLAALRTLAEENPDLIIAHSALSAEAAQIVAAEFPDIKFVVLQGDVVGANLSSYQVLQEESAWLAGAAAGLLTETGVVAHIAGSPDTRGLKGRGAFYNGLMHTNPQARFLSTFSGDEDNQALAQDAAVATIEAGADIIFTMLDAGRSGVTEVMREKQVKQIGDLRDWVTVDPGIFIGSAIADISLATLSAVRDVTEGSWQAGEVVKYGLDDPGAVSFMLGSQFPEYVHERLDKLRTDIVEGHIDVAIDYAGETFNIR